MYRGTTLISADFSFPHSLNKLTALHRNIFQTDVFPMSTREVNSLKQRH